MTYIEFFDGTHTANVCAMIANPPERVVLVGDKYKTLKKHADRYEEVLRARGFGTEILSQSVNKNNVSSIIDTLSSLVEKYGECHFDLTGGDDLLLCAAGIVFERYRHRGVHINMHRFNIRSGRVLDCDLDGVTVMDEMMPEISVQENIRIWGGASFGRQYSISSFSDADKDDIARLWELCRDDVKAWNKNSNLLSFLEGRYAKGRERSATGDCDSILCVTYEVEKPSLMPSRESLDLLAVQGLIRYTVEKSVLCIDYKSTLVKKCIMNAGLVLELAVLVSSSMAKDKHGKRVYNDVRSGIRIDWDGEIDEKHGTYDTENEVDVMLMHGALPLFVSCKNGDFDIEELYKLNSVSERFGREYSKKFIVATSLGHMNNKAKYLRARAADMNIRIIDRAHTMDMSALSDFFADIWM